MEIRADKSITILILVASLLYIIVYYVFKNQIEKYQEDYYQSLFRFIRTSEIL